MNSALSVIDENFLRELASWYDKNPDLIKKEINKFYNQQSGAKDKIRNIRDGTTISSLKYYTPPQHEVKKVALEYIDNFCRSLLSDGKKYSEDEKSDKILNYYKGKERFNDVKFRDFCESFGEIPTDLFFKERIKYFMDNDYLRGNMDEMENLVCTYKGYVFNGYVNSKKEEIRLQEKQEADLKFQRWNILAVTVATVVIAFDTVLNLIKFAYWFFYR